MRACTAHTIVSEPEFLRELMRVRRQGYAVDNEETELGVCCIAAAIPDYRGRASYALSISAPLARMSDDRIDELRRPLLAARNEISVALGG